MTEPLFLHPKHTLGREYANESGSNTKPFPLFLTPPADADELETSPESVLSYLKEHRDHLLQLLEEHTVLFFRNFAKQGSTPVHFSKYLIEGLGFDAFPYALGNAVRKSIVGDIVFTANEAPPDKLIPFHHELAQTPSYPSYISFFCNLPCESGGETPIVNSIKVYEELQARVPEFIEKCERLGVLYKRKMTAHDRKESAIGRGWKSTFNVEKKEEVEKVLANKKYQWSWEHMNGVEILQEISPPLHAVINPRNSEKKAFFNQMFAAWNGWIDEFNQKGDALSFGNGEKISKKHMEIVGEVLNAHSVAIPWEKGDFMVIDNLQAMHSRNSFTGKRSILASLLK